MSNITSANAVFTLTVAELGISANLQGFAADDIFDTEAIELGEVLIGVDGYVSSGYVHALVKQSIMLQADSPSIALFENWIASEQAAVDKYPASATITLKATGRIYTMNTGFLASASLIPDAKKVLQPRKFNLVWQSVTTTPF